MITAEHVFLTSGVVLSLLISAIMLNYTTRFVFVSDKLKKPTNQIYDVDLSLNCSAICIFSQNPYKTRYDNSSCFNKTLLQWYNPWLRHNLWSELWAKTKAKPRLELKEESEVKIAEVTEAPTPNETSATDHPKGKRKADARAVKEKPVEFVYSVLVGLLVVSGIVACWEVFKEKLKRNEAAAAKAQERQCSLAEFTIKRHLRRESQQQTGSHLPRQPSLELAAKVTQTLIHQSSLDRAFPKNTSEALSSLEPRRNSVPLNLSDVQSITGAKSGKRQSMDVSGEDVGSDTRRKSRHFIRRH